MTKLVYGSCIGIVIITILVIIIIQIKGAKTKPKGKLTLKNSRMKQTLLVLVIAASFIGMIGLGYYFWTITTLLDQI